MNGDDEPQPPKSIEVYHSDDDPMVRVPRRDYRLDAQTGQYVVTGGTAEFFKSLPLDWPEKVGGRLVEFMRTINTETDPQKLLQYKIKLQIEHIPKEFDHEDYRAYKPRTPDKSITSIMMNFIDLRLAALDVEEARRLEALKVEEDRKLEADRAEEARKLEARKHRQRWALGLLASGALLWEVLRHGWQYFKPTLDALLK